MQDVWFPLSKLIPPFKSMAHSIPKEGWMLYGKFRILDNLSED